MIRPYTKSEVVKAFAEKNGTTQKSARQQASYLWPRMRHGRFVFASCKPSQKNIL